MDIRATPDLANSNPPGTGVGGGAQQVFQASTINQMPSPPIAPFAVVQTNQQVDGAAEFGQVPMDPQGGMQMDLFMQQMPGGAFYFLFLYFFTSSAGKSFRLCLILKNGLFRGALKKKYFLKVLRQWLNWGGKGVWPS